MKKCKLDDKLHTMDRFSDKYKKNLFVFEIPEEDS
jgi:hypothetical protein